MLPRFAVRTDSGGTRLPEKAEVGVDGHDVYPGPDLKIERAGFPVWRAALIGAGIAAGAAPLMYPHNKDKMGTAAVAGLIGAAWGAWFAHTIYGRTVVNWAAP